MARYLWVMAALVVSPLAASAQAPGSPTNKFVGSPLPATPVLPLDLALSAASTAVGACAAQGYRETAVIVDADGVPRATLRGDGAGVHTLDSAFRKAYTAASFRTPTTELAERAAANPAFNGLRFIDKVIFAGGGLPIRAGDAVLGAIGAAGAPGFEKDDACAKAGLDAIADRLH